MQVERVEVRAQRHGEDGRAGLDEGSAEPGPVAIAERAGDAHAVAEEQHDTLPLAILVEGVEGLGEALLEVGGAGGVVRLLHRLEDGGEFVPGLEAPGEILRFDVDRPDGGTVVGPQILDEGSGQLAGHHEGAAGLAGRIVDQDEVVARPRLEVLVRLQLELELPGEIGLAVLGVVGDDVLSGELGIREGALNGDLLLGETGASLLQLIVLARAPAARVQVNRTARANTAPTALSRRT